MRPFPYSNNSQDFTLDIDQILSKRSPAMINNVQRCLENALPFSLSKDGENFAVIIPSMRMIVRYKNGVEMSQEVMVDDQQFINNVKYCITGFDHFTELGKKKRIILSDDRSFGEKIKMIKK